MVRHSSFPFQALVYYETVLAAPKRFYKNTNVLYNDGKYEITLDHKKLKTPRGNPFTLKSEPMAIAVATEWANQKGTIVQTSMHLSALCFTSVDNPNNLTKPDMVNYLLNFLPTDTVLFQTQVSYRCLLFDVININTVAGRNGPW